MIDVVFIYIGKEFLYPGKMWTIDEGANDFYLPVKHTNLKRVGIFLIYFKNRTVLWTKFPK